MSSLKNEAVIRNNLKNSYQLNQEYYSELSRVYDKNKERIQVMTEQNVILESKLKVIKEVMAGVEDVAKQLTLFDKDDYIIQEKDVKSLPEKTNGNKKGKGQNKK